MRRLSLRRMLVLVAFAAVVSAVAMKGTYSTHSWGSGDGAWWTGRAQWPLLEVNIGLNGWRCVIVSTKFDIGD